VRLGIEITIIPFFFYDKRIAAALSALPTDFGSIDMRTREPCGDRCVKGGHLRECA
jgi:hypothetical protein